MLSPSRCLFDASYCDTIYVTHLAELFKNEKQNLHLCLFLNVHIHYFVIDNLPFKTVGNSQNPFSSDKDTATDVPTWFTL